MSVVMTAERWRQLVNVNRVVNEDVRYRTDLDLYRQPEFWAIADDAGDCEDYALAKRQRLLALGWPLEALRLATCRIETGEGHAVLTIDTDAGAYVLDNRHAGVRAWRDLPYQWDRRQAAGGSHWVSVESP